MSSKSKKMGLCPHIVSGFTNSGIRDYGMGASVGYKVMDNMWLSLGYNVRGLNDRDFTAAAYRARSLFVTLRMKVDQDTFGLNKGSKTIRPVTLGK